MPRRINTDEKLTEVHHTRRCNQFSFAVPVRVIAIRRFDSNLQTGKNDRPAENISPRLQAIRHQSERVTHKSPRTLCNREAKIYRHSEKCGSPGESVMLANNTKGTAGAVPFVYSDSSCSYWPAQFSG